MKKNLSLIVASLIVLAVIGFVGYHAYWEAHPKIPTTFDNLKVAYQEDGINNYVMIDVAEDKGYFKQNGLTIERKVGLKSISSFVISGEVDLSLSALGVPLSGFFSDQDLKVVAMTERYSSMMNIVSRFPEDMLSSLKNIEVDRAGGAIQNNFWVMSKNLGVDPSTMNYVVSATPQATVALLDKGSVDLGMLTNYEAYKTLRESGKYTFIDPQKAYGDAPSPLGVVTTSKTITAKADALKRFIASERKASAYFAKHKDEMVTFIVNKYGFSKEDAEAAYIKITASTKGLDYTVDVDLLKNITESVKAVNKPSNPNRDIQEFIGKL